MTLRPVTDARRWAGFRCFGTYELFIGIHACHEDLIGALDAGQLPLVRYAARELIRECLQVRAFAAGGFPPDDHDPLADPYAGLPDAVVAEGLAVAAAIVRASDLAAARAAAPAVDAYVRQLERDLDFTRPPRSIRQGGGLFPALRMTRDLIPMNRAAHLPLALPSTWRSDGGADATPNTPEGN